MKYSGKIISALIATVAIGNYVQNNTVYNDVIIHGNAQAYKVDTTNPTKIVTSESDRGTKGYRCSFTLRQVLNAAITELMSGDTIFVTLLNAYSSLPYFPLYSCPAQTSSAEFYKYPEYDADKLTKMAEEYDALPDTAESGDSKENYKFYDVFEEILITGVLKVAGSGYDSSGSIIGFDWGDAGNYTLGTPTGFFYEYLQSIIAKINAKYTTLITVQYVYAVEPTELVKSGTAHMTDIYMLQGAADTSVPKSPVTNFDKTCPVIGAEYNVATLSTASIESISQLNSAIDTSSSGSGDASTLTVLFRTKADLDMCKKFLSVNAIPTVYTPDAVSMEGKVAAGEAVAAFKLDPLDTGVTGVTTFSSGIASSMGPWLAKTNYDFCIWNEYSGSPLTATVNLILLTITLVTAGYYMYF